MNSKAEPMTVTKLKRMKKRDQRITMLTAYDRPSARLAEMGGVDVILVGDSLGMAVLGYKDTLPVRVDDMISHAAAVVRTVSHPLVVVDMPFMSFQVSIEDTLRNAGRMIKESGAASVKLEGGDEVCPQVRALSRAGIPVMGHIGLTPQAVHQLGGFRVQGQGLGAAKKLLIDAQLLEEAGAFALVLECIPRELAAMITESVTIPTIGIGAGGDCDGQVLVFHDLVGLFDEFTPRFARRYAEVGGIIEEAIRGYCRDVRASGFPGPEETFTMDPKHVEELRSSMDAKE